MCPAVAEYADRNGRLPEDEMATYDDYRKLVKNMGIYDDCPLCGLAYPMCNGLCVAHESANGRPGPFHFEFNDDCKECGAVAEYGGDPPGAE